VPRPKSIAWEKRLAVFLDYRRSRQKVNPVANRHVIARSTARAIVKEFVDMGFSERPRAKVSEALLKEMQEQHLGSLGKFTCGEVGSLNLGPGTENEVGRQEAYDEPLPASEEALWHLRGTRAEKVIREAREAARDYLGRESEVWQDLRSALEEACKLPESEGAIGDDPEPHLLPALKRRLRNAFFEGGFLSELPPPSWLQWELAPDDPRVLRLQGEPVGVGRAEDHQRCREGVKAFLANNFRKHQRRFLEVWQLRKDMMLVGGIVAKAVGGVTEDDIRRGICPACPYPEASLELITGPRASKRRTEED
jgi:hypothetical protein